MVYPKHHKNRKGLPGFLKWAIMMLALGAVCLGLMFHPGSRKPALSNMADTRKPQITDSISVRETEPADPVRDQAERILALMTPEEKICQLFIVTHDQLVGISGVTRSGEITRQMLQRYPVGGVIYFSPNLVDAQQCADMIRDLQSFASVKLFISVDEEGGSVSRLGKNRKMGVHSFPNMGTIGKNGDCEAAYQVGYTIGTDLAGLGFNLDFAPVADVNSNPRNPVIGTRSFHSDPAIAAELVAACVAGFGDSGMLCTLKHFPGHGDTNADSHLGEVRLDKSLEDLMACELIPFQAGIGAGAPVVMVGHITVPAVSGGDVPATFSAEVVTGLLRQRMGFEGLIVTDSMQMGAVTDRYTSGQAAVLALQAGVDLILMPENLEEAVRGIREAADAGELTWEQIEEHILRILEVKIRSGIIPMA